MTRVKAATEARTRPRNPPSRVDHRDQAELCGSLEPARDHLFLKKDSGNALADIRQVLVARAPTLRCLAGLGTILSEIGDQRRALDAFRRALAVHPRLNGIVDEVKSLTEKSKGARSDRTPSTLAKIWA